MGQQGRVANKRGSLVRQKMQPRMNVKTLRMPTDTDLNAMFGGHVELSCDEALGCEPPEDDNADFFEAEDKPVNKGDPSFDPEDGLYRA